MLNVYTLCPRKYFGSNTYLLESEGEFAVIDPSVSYSEALSSHPEIEGKIKYILLTHAHFDHILKLSEWADTGAVVKVGAKDAEMLKDPYLNCYLGFMGTEDGYFGRYETISEGDKIRVGKTVFTVMETPGHTPGGICYITEGIIFSGDTLFADGGYGRCDLPLGDEDALERSLVRIFSLENDALVYPGHGDVTTLSKSIKFFM